MLLSPNPSGNTFAMKADCPIRCGPHGLFAHSPPAAPWVVPHGAQESLLSYLILLPPSSTCCQKQQAPLHWFPCSRPTCPSPRQPALLCSLFPPHQPVSRTPCLPGPGGLCGHSWLSPATSCPLATSLAPWLTTLGQPGKGQTQPKGRQPS